MPPRSSLHPPLSGQVSLDLRETDAYALNMSSKSMRGPLPPLFRLSIFPRERDILSSYAFIASFGLALALCLPTQGPQPLAGVMGLLATQPPKVLGRAH